MGDEVRPLPRGLLQVIRTLHRLRVRGLGRLLMLIARHSRKLQMVPAPMEDGRILFLDLRDPYQMPYFLEGRIPWEQGETEFVRRVVRSGDVVVDGGASIGWYTTLLAELVGPRGKVYAFEPNSYIYRLLTMTTEKYIQVKTVCAALGKRAEEKTLYIPFSGSFKASLTPLLCRQGTQKCHVVPLDEVLGTDRPVFIKLDIEGAELDALQGAKGVLQSPRPPIWMIEVSAGNLHRFGYKPVDLFRFFESFPHAEYACFRIRSEDGMCESLDGAAFERASSAMFYAAFVPKGLFYRVEGLLTTEGF